MRHGGIVFSIYRRAVQFAQILTLVKNPVAVDPDDTLRVHAEDRGWRIMSLR